MKESKKLVSKREPKTDKISYNIVGADGRKSTIESHAMTHLNFDSRSAKASLDRSGNRQYMGRNYTGSGSTSSLGITYVDLQGHQMIQECMNTYRGIGVVKNIIDLMADFATEGVDIIHESQANKRFWDAWKEKINLEDTINKMIVTILMSGNLAVERRTTKITKDEEKDMKSQSAAMKRSEKKRELVIPYKYKILNPLGLDPKGIDQDGDVILDFRSGADASQRKTISNDPNYFIAYYKRNDWEKFGTPFHYAALQDIAFENKMMRMDEAAMDGVINMIRIWKIGGQLKDGTPIFPDAGATSRLATMLQNDTQGGVLDIIWDQFLELDVEYPDVSKILGSDKYNHPRQKILEDFGIAEVLIDGTGNGSYSNQYLSVASLIEKLKYLRAIIKSWIMREVKFVAKNMNMKKMPEIKFKHIDLSDKNAERAIALQCVDRGLMSKEQFLEYFNEKWEIEKQRISKEKQEERDNPDLERVSPIQNSTDSAVDPNTGKEGGDGRPANQPQEKTQKKKRVTKPTGASEEVVNLMQEAKKLSEKISEYVDPIYFKAEKVKHIKQLSKESRANLENIKFTLLANSSRNQDINDAFLKEIESSGAKKLNLGVKKIYRSLLAKYIQKENRQPTKEESDNLKIFSWVISNFEE